MTRRQRFVTLLVLLAALALAGPIACGKRGRLEPPADKESIWPRSYPAN